ncbi:MAG: trypsin-like peptidase domain-containing protein [Rhodospirillales bacterium]|nr:trypsin-like peptidase domain-containing protein [Rhodospirillales bacterium]MBO6785332.1 trypsin-like peptidase domain-containing protein [Rhodospirillales bacterium]
MRLRDIMALILLGIVVVAGQIMRAGPDAPSPAPPPSAENPRRPAPKIDPGKLWAEETESWLNDGPSQRFRLAPDWSPPERRSFVDVGPRKTNGTGTAFAIGDGKWLTARHVTDGCDDIGLQVAPRKGIKVLNVENHPNADVTLLSTRNGPTPFPLGPDAAKGDDGYMIGFPKGRPGAVHVTKIGTTVLQERGRYKTRERADVWSERSRIPDRFDSLGGLSGGPTFDDAGRIIGVVLAEEPRRGRVISAEPATLRYMNGRTGGAGKTETAGTLDAENYPATARGLLTSLRVAKVLCRVH